MCGIAGFVQGAGQPPPDAERLRAMANLLRHRGPDGEGFWISGPAALAHRRLSIIDLAGGTQPMSSEDGADTIVFNGEIYNFQDVRPLLEAKGHRFRTRSDTEVILAAYREWGPACVDRLNGMFAFALWDEKRRRLFAARDRLGKKPFYYAALGDRFVFASEIKSVLADPGVPREVDPAAVDEFLSRLCIGGERTIFRHVRKLPPAHRLLLEPGRLTVERYWSLAFRPDDPPRPEAEYLEELERTFEAAVRRRMISDVPLGAFLSGGVDSSMVVAAMARQSSRPVRTFTIGFEAAGYSEIEDARVVARHLGTDHAEHVVRPDAIEILPDLAWHFDEPFGDSSMIPTYYVCAMARREATVALSGDGGDEVFAGYLRYARALRATAWDRIPGAIRRGIFGSAAALLPTEAPARNRLLAIARHAPHAPGYDLGLYPYVKDRLLRPDFLERADLSRPRPWETNPTPEFLRMDLVSRMQWLDTTNYLPDDILVKVDRASMAHSLEVRAPLLDFELVEFMARVPAGLKYANGISKRIFKRLGARYLPESVFTKRKQGFAVPKAEWFRGALKDVARDRLLDARARGRGYFRPGAVERMLASHAAGKRDYSDWIWCLLVLEEWHRTFLDPGTRRI